MGKLKYYQDLDSHPFIGLRKFKVPIKAKIVDDEYTRHFFDGTENVEQVENVTIGKTYEICAVEGYGDVADFIFINDIGEEDKLGDFFFEEII